jgi:putative ABC transport system permease protein
MFLSFAGLTALLIGGVGVAGAVRNYLDGKAATIATLKCLGASGGLVTATYLLQILVLAGLGTALGLALGVVLPFLLLLETLDPLLPVRITLGVCPEALLAAAALGFLTALTFSLWPLGRARKEPASNLFRQGVVGLNGRPGAATLAATAAAALALAALAILTTADRLFGAIFAAGAVSTLLALRGSAAAVTMAARWLPRARPATVRLAVDGLKRPGAPTNAVLVALGAGLTVLVAVALIDGNLRAQIGERLPKTVPAFFFIDIQDDQVAAFDATVAPFLGPGGMRRVPALRGRVGRHDKLTPWRHEN